MHTKLYSLLIYTLRGPTKDTLCINCVVPLTSLSNQTNSLHKAYKDQIMKGLFMQRLGQNMIL